MEKVEVVEEVVVEVEVVEAVVKEEAAARHPRERRFESIMSIVRYVLDMSSAHCAPYESATCRSNRQKSRSSCARRR